MNVVDDVLRQVRERPDALAVVGVHMSATYAQLGQRIAAFAAAFAARGLRAGDVVAIGGRRFDYMCASLAAGWIGAIPLSVTDEAEAADLIPFISPAAGFFSEPGLVAAVAPRVRCAATFEELEKSAAGVQPPPVRDCGAQEIWRIGFSSGTTGRRKHMLFTHGSSIAKTRMLSSVREILGSRTMVEVGYSATFGLSYWLRELSRGATVVLGTQPVCDPAVLDQFGVDLLVASPASALSLARQLKAAGKPRPAALKAVLLGGAPVTPAQRTALRTQLCDNLWINYGATEVGMIALMGPRLMDADPLCAGRVMPWVECEVVGTEGRPLPAGETGRLRYRSASLAAGYLLREGASEADRHAFDRGWFQSSDRGCIRDGRLYLEARADDLLNVAGDKVDPLVVERHINLLPGVTESAVVLVPDEVAMPLLVAAVVTESGTVDESSIIRHCAASLPAPMVPAAVVSVTALPRNEAGKIERARLAAGLQFTRRAPPKSPPVA